MKQKYITTSKAADKWKVSKNDVAKACREGEIPEAFKNEKGSWQIPSNSKNPFSDSDSARISNKKENIIAVGIMIAIVVISLITIGFDSIEQWLAEPIIWKDADFVKVYLLDKEEVDEDKLTLQFAIENRSENTLDEFDFICSIGSASFRLNSIYDYINAYDIIVIDKTLTTNGTGWKNIKVDKKVYDSIKDSDLENLNFSYKIKSLKSHGDTLVNNNGVLKVVLILALSFILGVLGFSDIIKFSWLRILLKTCGLPAIIMVIIAIFVIAIIGGGSNSQKQNNSTDEYRKSAAENYKREANLKAGALAIGNQKEAASSQARMDKSMADMIMGAKSSSAKTYYKNAADAKAGMIRIGNQKEAAKQQALMDKYLADMINENKNE